MEPPGEDFIIRLNYFQWKPLFEKVKRYELLINVPKDYPVTNFEIAPEAEEVIQDIRGDEASFSLNHNGFAVRPHNSKVARFNKSNVENTYLKEIEDLLKNEVDDVSEIFFFNWRVSR